jgi:hypothetical protein
MVSDGVSKDYASDTDDPASRRISTQNVDTSSTFDPRIAGGGGGGMVL